MVNTSYGIDVSLFVVTYMYNCKEEIKGFDGKSTLATFFLGPSIIFNYNLSFYFIFPFGIALPLLSRMIF
jgi:hypothetical protein